MPNWCSNAIEIKGSKSKISKIRKVVESIKDDNESCVFCELVGIDPSVNQKDYDNGKWRDANVEYWGTKWDVSVIDCNFSFDENCIVMTPETAWAPPINFGVALSKKYGVEVTITYEECGVGFCGKTYIDGEGNFSDEEYSYMEGKYRFDEDGFWMSVEDDIDYYKEDKQEMSVEEFVEDRYPFVSKEDRDQIIEMFEESLDTKS